MTRLDPAEIIALYRRVALLVQVWIKADRTAAAGAASLAGGRLIGLLGDDGL
jgi:hypothetical protein